QINDRVARGDRVLVTTLTKKMAEDLTDYLLELGVRVRYLHSEVDTIQRIEILRALRLGEFDVLVGINLLREGLDLPEVSLVAILRPDDGTAPTPGRERRRQRERDQKRLAELAELPQNELSRLIQTLEEEMHEAAAELRFEYAARLRDEVNELKRELREASA